ncbi:Teichoic acids export ATP-binding protein TagH [compost metagenome]
MEAISIKNLSKSFKIYHDKPVTLKERALFLKKKTYKEMKIIDNINVSIEEGQMVGLIGHNGSGKSTLLKLLTKIIYPDKGEISIEGRVSSLLELGAGFHPDFTGIENIYMNASIFGLSKKDIDQKIEAIISFSELGEFIYNPVRTYSSGMYMRLAFAVAINIEPDILLVDEVLAVGDASFQRKCLNRIKQLKGANKTIVLVTHDHGVVERMCDRAIWLHEGSIKLDGRPKDVVNNYLAYLADKDQETEVNQRTLITPNENDIVECENTQDSNDNNSSRSNASELKELQSRWGNRDIEIKEVKVIGGSNKHLFAEEEVTIFIRYQKHKERQNVVFGVAFHTLDKIRVYGTNTQIDSWDDTVTPDEGIIKVYFPSINLIEGDYLIDIAVHDELGTMYDYIEGAANIRVLSKIHDVGYCRIPHTWSVEEV